MSHAQSSMPADKKRVKVYELRDNDWFDRGTGFCTGVIHDGTDPRLYVESEDEPSKVLLETRIVKEDRYQKQQDTLIVWSEPSSTDMALSFQEAEGCAAIWDFVQQVQQQLTAIGQQDVLDEEGLGSVTNNFTLNPPSLHNLDHIESSIRMATIHQAGREALAKFLVGEEYLRKLIGLVDEAEDLESLSDLHKLCNIMKQLILMNDNAVIEHIVTDDIILGVVGALEYDPDFPTHKANHRSYLSDASRYKEVVEIKDETIQRKIRHTWRLQYLKDVVLARILDDPTFGVLNSLIFFNQVEIVQHLQDNTAFSKELFSICISATEPVQRKEQAVQFIQQCTSITKTLQPGNRAALLNNFISHGLFSVIAFAVKHDSSAVRTTGVDILVALLDHDPNMMRGYMLRALHEKKIPLTDVLIELLHQETDLGVKNQLADAIKILLDPSPPPSDQQANQRPGAEYTTKTTRPQQLTPTQAANEQFAYDHFNRSCGKLFGPLKILRDREDLPLSYQETTLFTYLVEILTFFARQHSVRSKPLLTSESLGARIAQLLSASQKSLKLVALKFFRTCIALQDVFYTKLVLNSRAFDGILRIASETMSRHSLLNSACLELFEYVKKEGLKPVILHLGNNFKSRMQELGQVETFHQLLVKFDQLTDQNRGDIVLPSQKEENIPSNRKYTNGQWSSLHHDLDVEEENYFNGSDDDDISTEQDEPIADKLQSTPEAQRRSSRQNAPNGTSPLPGPLVDYPEDESETAKDGDFSRLKNARGRDDVASQPKRRKPKDDSRAPDHADRRLQPSPDIRELTDSSTERIPEKRRRGPDDDDLDELEKLSSSIKRRSSGASSSASIGADRTSRSDLRRKKSFLRSKASPDQRQAQNDDSTEEDDRLKKSHSRKIAISLNSAHPDSGGGDDDAASVGRANKKDSEPEKGRTRAKS